jgi:hypothetical protein
MKKFNKILMIFLCASGLLFNDACTKNFEEMNTNPELVTSDIVNIGLILTYVEWTGIVGEASYGNGVYGMCSGMDVRGDNSPFGDSDAPGEWNFEYGKQLNNLSSIIRIIESKSDKDKLVNKLAIARILKAWAVSKLTDTYGDVPYSESCLPEDQSVYQPEYDTQESIYRDLFKELKEAAASLDESKGSFGSEDMIYSGNVTKWRKLANSLRLRLALRIRYVNETLAREQMSDLTEEGLIMSLGDDAFVKNNTDLADHMNPRYYFIIGTGKITEEVTTHKVMIDILRNDSVNLDPRIKIYADTVMAAFKGSNSPNGYYFPNWDYRGAPSLGNVDVEYKYPWGSSTVSEIADFWRVPVVAPAILKCPEVYFALAEARLAGLLPSGFTGTPEEYYQKGIDASIDWYKWFYDLTAPQMPDLMLDYIHNVPFVPAEKVWTQEDVDEYLEYKRIKDEEVAAFKATEMYNLSGTEEEQLEKIMNQKIVALYPDEFQGWCEYRRTGYPKVPVGPDHSALNGVIPRREPWPTVEETINSKSFGDALSRYGTDSKLTRFWWDANPNAPHNYEWTAPSLPTDYQ